MSWIYLKNATLLTELNALVWSRETSAQFRWFTQMFLIQCTMFSALPGMPTPNCTGENVPGSFSLRLHMMTIELMSLWKMAP